jgi:glycosyltransferase involved in cell wall biosynthesis
MRVQCGLSEQAAPRSAGPECSSYAIEGGDLLVFADDWGRHPSSCQHLIRRLLERRHVTWVNTIGTRTPRLNWATVRRGIEKLRQWSRPKKQNDEPTPENLRVLNPKMWPWFGSRLSRMVNRKLLARQLAPMVTQPLASPTHQGGEGSVAVTTIPLVADLIGVLPVERWVYYCVDDFSQWPGLDQRTLERMERKLVEEADTIITVSETLRDRLAKMGREAHLLTHGVDLDFWTDHEAAPKVDQLDGLERPLVAFWGVLDRRMDTAFLAKLDESMDRGTIVLAGPSDAFDPAIERLRRVRRLGPLAFEQLPRLAQEAAVLVMPYADLPVTRAIQPLKLKEYLATGKPVVVRDLPATRPWSDCLDLADTPESFVAAVRSRLGGGVPAEKHAARARLADEGWDAKARDFERWVFDIQD